jgi:signal transduction histidine kinase
VASVPVILLLNPESAPYQLESGELALNLAALAALTSVGTLLALKVPANPIGWLLLANAGVVVLGGLAYTYAAYSLDGGHDLPGTRVAAAWNTWGWAAQFAGLVAIAFVFPDGRLPSPRWRPAAILGAVSFAMVLIGGMFWADEPLDAPFENVEPLSVLPAGVAEVVHNVGLAGMIVTLILAALAVRSRFKDADGELRAQIKWVAYAAVLIPIAIIAGTIEGVALDREPGALTALPFIFAMVALAAAIGIAVLRYRLYEIDRLISVTLVYATLTALLAAAFAAITLAGGVALGGGAGLPTAAATLAVALAFRPLRSRVQSAVDRRFNPERYEGLRHVDGFLAELREGRAEPEAIGDVIAEAVSDPSLRLYFWLPRDSVHADARGRLVADLPGAPDGRTPVSRGELTLGTIVHDPRLAKRAVLLDSVIVRAGLAIEIARLRVEVRHQLAEVEASRARIVTAAEEERHRLERDLHDGAQQRLVSIGLDLRHLQQGLDDRAETRAGLDRAVGSLTEAIAELRELAHGMRPVALDGGLGPALRELAARAPIATDVEATDERFADDIEAAAYFVASEGLTNAVKHADGSRVVLRAGRSDGVLVVEITDDGCGGAAATNGSGLTGLADRVAALGGRLELNSEHGQGTALRAELPCG